VWLAPLSGSVAGLAGEPEVLFRALPKGEPSRRPCLQELARVHGRAIGRREGRAFILRHELLGTVGNAVMFFGLRDPTGKLWSVVGFGHGPHAAGADIVLERARPSGGRRTMPRRT
jgi:hypothetical protein